MWMILGGIKLAEYTRGSEWRRWDLHVHTPESFEQNFQSWDSYLNALETVREVSVIGITDYFSIEGYKKIIKELGKGRLGNFELILPNIELRLNIFIPKRSAGEQQRRLNFHVIFSDKVAVQDIERQFLNDLDIVLDGNPDGGNRRKLTREAIEEAGQLVKRFQTSVQGDSDFVAGCKSITVSLQNVLDALDKGCFEGQYLLILPTEYWDQISWEGQDYLTRRNLLQTAHIVFCGQTSTINWCLGRGDLTPEQFKDEFGSLKPALHGSDAHTENEICFTTDDKYCWIKADPTFEGLKQIVYEPEERVKIQRDCPEDEHKKIYIEKLNFTQSSGFPIQTGTELPLNKNLVAIVGGRGNGKSALAECIAFCFDKHAKEPVNGKERFIPYFQKQGANFSLDLTLGDRDNNLQSAKRELKSNDEPISFPFEYLGQNKIEEFAMDDTKVHKLISNSIFSSSRHYADYQTALQKIDDYKKNVLTSLSQIEIINKQIMSLHIKDVKSEKKKKEEEKRLLNSTDTKETIEKLTEAKEKHSLAKVLIKQTEELINELKLLQQTTNKKLRKVFDVALGLGISINVPKITVEEALASLSSLLADPKLLIIKRDYLSALAIARDKLQAQIDVSVERIAVLTEEIKRLEKLIEYYETNLVEVEKLQEARNSNYVSLISSYNELRNAYKNAIDEFAAQDIRKAILKDVVFSPELHFMMDKLLEQLFQRYVDKRKCKTFSNFKKRFTFTTAEQFAEWLIDNADKDETYDIFLESSKKEILEALFEDYLELSTSVKLKVGNKEVPLEHLSLGQKGTVILKLFLATTNCPIVFDQPEDHLDNNFIYTTLVPTFIEAKKKRQIIVITHNANLVINGDAEQIIVAKYENDIFSYSSGSIENPEIRTEIGNVLEGGQEAFEKREQKYAFDTISKLIEA